VAAHHHSFGYPAHEEALRLSANPGNLREVPTGRRELSDVVSWERPREPSLNTSGRRKTGHATTADMTLQGQYIPSPRQWVRDQVEGYERSGGKEANTLRDTGLPVVIVTMRGNKSGNLRKIALMRVEHGGEYALVGSRGGAPTHPQWVYNLRANPNEVTIQDGPEPFEAEVRELNGSERQQWWDRAVAAYPPYADYQTRTQRQIPVFLARRKIQQ
jgi:deazaflavin-dependent oxidoreductase (nitroreductase family)